MLDELSEMIIPTDAHSPGARAAKSRPSSMPGSPKRREEKARTEWRAGLALVDRLSQEANGASFMKSSPEQRLAVLTRMAQKSPGE